MVFDGTNAARQAIFPVGFIPTGRESQEKLIRYEGDDENLAFFAALWNRCIARERLAMIDAVSRRARDLTRERAYNATSSEG